MVDGPSANRLGNIYNRLCTLIYALEHEKPFREVKVINSDRCFSFSGLDDSFGGILHCLLTSLKRHTEHQIAELTPGSCVAAADSDVRTPRVWQRLYNPLISKGLPEIRDGLVVHAKAARTIRGMLADKDIPKPQSGIVIGVTFRDTEGWTMAHHWFSFLFPFAVSDLGAMNIVIDGREFKSANPRSHSKDGTLFWFNGASRTQFARSQDEANEICDSLIRAGFISHGIDNPPVEFITRQYVPDGETIPKSHL